MNSAWGHITPDFRLGETNLMFHSISRLYLRWRRDQIWWVYVRICFLDLPIFLPVLPKHLLLILPCMTFLCHVRMIITISRVLYCRVMICRPVLMIKSLNQVGQLYPIKLLPWLGFVLINQSKFI